MSVTPSQYYQSGRRHAVMTSQPHSLADDSLVPLSVKEKRPRRLLDLPVEILDCILKELHHTNDFTSLALCHSTLHALAIPFIYNRFDIVWPDNVTGLETRTGVDALTYGLSTLVMAKEVFGSRRSLSPRQQVRRRRGNHYASFIKKFSLGNGPPEWVEDYLITKEGGKMLGTLVALALPRMRILESFTWDMPTGVLCAVWDSLSSLADHPDGQPCRLERVSIRWHDNSAEPRNTPVRVLRRQGDVPPPLSALCHVESPSFSILPPLKSLSVLDIDEVQYLDELSVLISRSSDRLRELRIGIAPHATHRDFVAVWEGSTVAQIDRDNPVMSCITVGEKRLGGILGVLTGIMFDFRSAGPKSLGTNRLIRRINTIIGTPQVSDDNDPLADEIAESIHSDSTTAYSAPVSTSPSLSEHSAHGTTAREGHGDVDPKLSPSVSGSVTLPHRVSSASATIPEHRPVNHADHSSDAPQRLSLEILELEEVPLFIPILQDAIDWSTLTTLTLLGCRNHEHLWKALRRQFAPSPSSSKSKYMPDMTCLSISSTRKTPGSDLAFKLNLKHIHTDTVSSSLISFIKDTLRPNSLESVFFLHASSYRSSVRLDSIFNGVLRRHRTSLKKLLVDSGERGSENSPGADVTWRQWTLSREIIKFLGRMPCLKELGVILDYHDWHFFLQNLPSLSNLGSLYLPYIVNTQQGGLVDARELALQIVDIVALRPEMPLLYIGILKQCYEVLEQQGSGDSTDRSNNDGDSASEGVEDDDEGSGHEEEDEDDEDDDDDDDSATTDSDTHDVYEDSDLDASEDQREEPAFGLREILYYDDKVSVFKARHGRL